MNRPDNNDVYFQILKATAERSTCTECKDAALLVSDNRLVATAYNGSAPNSEHCIDYWKKRHNAEWDQYEKERSEKLLRQKSPTKTPPIIRSSISVDTNFKPPVFDATNRRSLSASNQRKKSSPQLSRTQSLAKAIKSIKKTTKDDTDIKDPNSGSDRSSVDEEKSEPKEYLTLSKTRDGSYQRYMKSKEFAEDHKEWESLNENHSILNLICHCASRGVPTKGAVLYCLYSPCIDCAKMIVASGIVRIFFRIADESSLDGLQYLRNNDIPTGKYEIL